MATNTEQITIGHIADRVAHGITELGSYAEAAERLGVSTTTLSTFKQSDALERRKGKLRKQTIVKMAKSFDPDNVEGWLQALDTESSTRSIRFGFPHCIWSAPLFQVAETPPAGCEFSSSPDPSPNSNQSNDYYTADDLTKGVGTGEFDVILVASDVVGSNDPYLRRVARILHSGPGPLPILYLPQREGHDDVQVHQQLSDAELWRCLTQPTVDGRKPRLIFAPGTVAEVVVDELLNSDPTAIDRSDARLAEQRFELVRVSIARSESYAAILDCVRERIPFVLVTWAPFSYWAESKIRSIEPDQVLLRRRLSGLFPRLDYTPIEFDLFVRRDLYEEITRTAAWRRFWRELWAACELLRSQEPRGLAKVRVTLAQRFGLSTKVIDDELDKLRFNLMVPGNLTDWSRLEPGDFTDRSKERPS